MMSTYNGWSGHIRTVRGGMFYRKLKASGKIRPDCDLCGGNGGLTYHAEEYGSTWEDYIQSCHPLCAYCHGMVHLRFEHPNRWARLLHRVGNKTHLPFRFESLHGFFTAARGLKDIPEEQWKPSGVSWADVLPKKMVFHEHMKVALVKVGDGLFIPDPKVYTSTPKSFVGLRYDAQTGLLHEYEYTKE